MWVVHESEMRRYKVPSESRQGSPPVSVLALESPESDQHQISPHSSNPWIKHWGLRIKEMITNSRSFRLFDKFSLKELKEM